MGRLDVDSMLEEMTREEFDEWMASDFVDPWADRWEAMSHVEASTANWLYACWCALTGTEADEAKLLTARQLMPRLPQPSDAKQQDDGISRAEQAFRSRYGG